MPPFGQHIEVAKLRIDSFGRTAEKKQRVNFLERRWDEVRETAPSTTLVDRREKLSELVRGC